MTEQSFPITPPPELLDQWLKIPGVTPITKMAVVTVTTNRLQMLATEAARWGADHELDACCEWLDRNSPVICGYHLRIDRRPKQPSLKEQAKAELNRLIALIPTEGALAMAEPIRRALEQLDD